MDGYTFGGGNAMNCVDIATQTEEWTFTVGAKVTTTPAVCDGVVYFATGKNEKKLYAVDIVTGTEVWSRYLYGSLSSPAISDGMVYIGDKEFVIHCFDAGTGTEIWNRTTGSGCFGVYSSPVVAGGMVYTAANYDKGTIYCFDADCGTLIWSYDTNQHNMAQPAVSDGTLFIGSDSGYLYAFSDLVIKGDLNGDRKVTTTDAVIALQMTVGAVPAIDEADMDGDCRVTSVDALMVLRVAAGSINA
jgi:outer membrane protein assembly factor BamB